MTDNENYDDENELAEVLDSNIETAEEDDSGYVKRKRISGGFRVYSSNANDWTTKFKPRFVTGDRVLFKNGRTGAKVSYVVSPGTNVDTYDVLRYGHREPVTISGNLLELAPEERWSEWKPYSEIHDPFQISGLKVSCPSNEEIRAFKKRFIKQQEENRRLRRG